MMLWRLWNGLKHPAYDHPMFLRVRTDIYSDSTHLSRLIQSIFLQGQIWLWPLLFVIDMRLVCLMALGGSISGLVLSLLISDQIAHEQHGRTYDLLCLTPGGTIRTLWAICTGCLHREDAFEILNSNEAWIVRLGLLVPFIVSSQLLLERLFNLPHGISLLWGIGFVALYSIDHVHSTVFGCLVGMLSAQASKGIDARLWSAILFLSFQVGTILVTLVASLFLLPNLSEVFRVLGVSVEIGQVTFIVVLFYAVRQFVLTWAWRWLLQETNTHVNELDMLKPMSNRAALKPYDDVQTVART
ncbi:MAG: hypothetical protein LCI00_31845 [Chloroflexi bacterium]|nr:hypothetical protein [Chloroflexota bacterium]